MENPDVKITIVYDNEKIRNDLKTDWGFSSFIETKETNLLFDTGANGDILLYNMEKLNIDPKDIDAVFLSHNHWDHIGGLDRLLKVRPELTVYKPGFSSKPKEFLPNLITTGMLGRWSIKEQSLICVTKKGLVVIGGCSHPGLENILDVAKTKGKIYAVLGGFHGFNKFEALKNIPLILPCHCTRYKQKIAELYPTTCSKCGAGKILEI